MVNLDVAFLIAGVILLVVGIVGHLEIKDVKVGTENPIARIVLGLIGFLFIGVSLFLYSSHDSPSPTASTIIAPTSPPSPIVSISPLETPSPKVSHIPIINKVVEWEDYKAGDLYLYKDIFFSDVDGDASLVAYELLSASIAGIKVNNDPILSSPSEQVIGTYVTGAWDCQKIGAYTIVLRARILDRAGNQSDPVDLTFNCR